MDSYMLRSPIFPIEVLIDMLRTDENIIEKISSNHILREGLVGTTHNLIEEVDKKNINVTNTLIKYLIRSTTRCTPYGELSGISEGKFDSVSKIIRKDPSQNIKKSRVDMGWFCSVISDL